ncbi:MAG: MFS transporter [Chloroflexi bacterium]|nr:MFS transporter [Chloroflexota bacterium]
MLAPSPSKGNPPRVFYGWYIIAACMVSGVLGAGTAQLFMGIMLKPITTDLGWNRTAASGAITAGTFAAGLLSPFVGRLVDRYGARAVMSLGGLIVAAAYWGLGSVNELWQFYVVYVVARGVGSVALSGVAPMAAAATWFRRKRGRALGFVAMALPLGGAILTPIGQGLLDAYGWRTVFFVFAVVMLVGGVVPAALVIRRRPEDLGLLPDGDTAAPPGAAAAGPHAAPEVSWTLQEAIRTRSLWLLIGALFTGLLANGGIAFHQVAYFTDMGIAAGSAAIALSVYGLSGAFSSGLWGYLTERVSERTCGVLAMTMAVGAIVLLLFVRDFPAALLFAVVFGIAARGESSLVNMILAQYFGRESYGAISGFVTPFQMVGLGLGPTVASVGYDLFGSYVPVFIAFMGCFILSGTALFLAKKPEPPRRSAAPVSAQGSV